MIATGKRARTRDFKENNQMARTFDELRAEWWWEKRYGRVCNKALHRLNISTPRSLIHACVWLEQGVAGIFEMPLIEGSHRNAHDFSLRTSVVVIEGYKVKFEDDTMTMGDLQRCAGPV